MAQRKHSLAAIAGGQALKPRAKLALQPKPVAVQAPNDADHFITRDGVTFAGHHLIIDLWEAEGLDDQQRIEQAMRDAVEAAGATLLHIHLHTFDVFMCGNAEPKKALTVLEQAFAAKRTVLGCHKRGVL
jgi:S-adenosylmethionine decarboxylase